MRFESKIRRGVKIFAAELIANLSNLRNQYLKRTSLSFGIFGTETFKAVPGVYKILL